MRLQRNIPGVFGRQSPALSLPVTPGISARELKENVGTLSKDELEIYGWLKEGYSVGWTAETLMLGRAELKMAVGRIFRKLGVTNRSGLIRYYGALDRTPEPNIGSLCRMETLFERYGLDRRERETAVLLLTGKPQKSVVTAVYAIQPDAKIRIMQLLCKLNIRSRAELVCLFE
jgi:DNA-binding CsgD family transcriptional regulator